MEAFLDAPIMQRLNVNILKSNELDFCVNIIKKESMSYEGHHKDSLPMQFRVILFLLLTVKTEGISHLSQSMDVRGKIAHVLCFLAYSASFDKNL